MNSELIRWNDYAATYDAAVFHVTKYERIRKKILSVIRHGFVLDLGCGPRGLLLNDIQRCGDIVIGLDFSWEMLSKARTFFSGTLICSDARALPFQENAFDSVTAINSILPPERPDVVIMFREIGRILRPDGRLVAYLPSYDYGTKCIAAGMSLKRDAENFREWDNNGWQCQYTENILENLMQEANFSSWHVENEVFNKEEEVQDANRVYGIDLSFDFSRLPIEEYFLIATK